MKLLDRPRPNPTPTTDGGVVHGCCALCYPSPAVGDVVTSFCGITGPSDYGGDGPLLSRTPHPCVVCVDLMSQHLRAEHPDYRAGWAL